MGGAKESQRRPSRRRETTMAITDFSGATDYKVQISTRVSGRTKSQIDLAATAFDIEKAEVIERAVEEFIKQRGGEIDTYLQRARASIAGLSDQSPGELFLDRRRPGNYRGGPVRASR